MCDSIANCLRPQKDLENIIAQFTKSYMGGVIGVHVRRGDNVPAAKVSTLDEYYKAMDIELEKNPEHLFYVASDDYSVKEEMKRRYGKIILYTDLCLERDSVQGKDAVVDLYCLGKTDKILGSHYSSYSLVASRLFNSPLVVIK